MASISGDIGVNVLPPPSHFSNKIFVIATEVMEDVSRATVWIFSTGTLLTSRIDRTARREAIATPGKTRRSGITAYAAEGMMPISASPASRARAQAEGRV